MQPPFKFLISFLLPVFFVLNAQCQEKTKVKPGLLWEISGKGMAKPSFIFGTYHLIGKDFLDTLPGVLSRLKTVSSVVGEVIIEEDMVMAQKLRPMMLLKDTTLQGILSDEEFAEVDSFLKAKSGMSLSSLNGLKPSAVQIMLIAFLVPQNISTQNPALDMFIQTEAKKLNKKVLGFETLEEQGKLLFDSPLDRQKEVLLKTVRESESMIRVSKELFDQYITENLLAIEKAFLENDDFTPDEMEALLLRRNKNWIAQMPGMMRTAPVFFAVGAGHLVGEEGLVQLLKKLGYTLKPLSLK